MKKLFFLIPFYSASIAIYCLEDSYCLESQKEQFLIKKTDFSIQENSKSHSCSKAYKKYRCKNRLCDAVVSGIPAICCLGIREGITDCFVWASSPSTSFMQAHAQMWCSRDMWFPCFWGTRQEICTSIAGNCSTGIMIASIGYALYRFLPCSTQVDDN